MILETTISTEMVIALYVNTEPLFTVSTETVLLLNHLLASGSSLIRGPIVSCTFL